MSRLLGVLALGTLLVAGACGDARPRSAHAAGSAPRTTGAPGDASETPDAWVALRSRIERADDPALDSVYLDPVVPLWVDGRDLTEAGRVALARLEGAERHGLRPDRYGVAAIRDARRSLRKAEGPARPAAQARLDTRLTRGVALLARDLATGRLPATGFDPGWRIDSTDAALPAPGDARRLLAHLDSVRPHADQYGRLVDVLARLRSRIRDGGWPEVAHPDRPISVGDSADAVVTLRRRLAASLSADERRLARRGRGHPTVLDSSLVRSLTRFQERHDLAADGVLGPETLEALNTPARDRAHEVEIALERWRWLPARLGTRALLVNTPGRRLHLLENGRQALTMKVIVGERDWKTTLFQDEMERMVVNPRWIVPGTILEEETLPRARRDPEYLRRNGFQAVEPETGDTVPLESVDWQAVDAEELPFRIRQTPGPQNALGTVKFLFPNRHAIYLHDTPADHLFDDRMRTFSHGCIRVEEPGRLARYLLRETTDRPPDRFAELRATGERHVVPLDRPVPTYIVYQTVWVDAAGAPTFTPDVYGRNAPVRSAFERVALPPARTSQEDS